MNQESEAELRSVLTEQCSIEGARRLVEAIDRGEIEPNCYASSDRRCGCIYFNLVVPEQYRDRIFDHPDYDAPILAERFIHIHANLKPFFQAGWHKYTYLEVELFSRRFVDEDLQAFLAEVRAITVEVYPELAE